MDMFSAYGIAFVMNEGANRRLRTRSKSKGATGGGGFWFPFAFRASAFLRHFRQTITSPEVLDSVADVPENTLQAIALQRSTGTIACIEEKLAARDAGVAMSDSVIRGVLASICYNVRFDERAARLMFGKGSLTAVSLFQWTVIKPESI
jgi:hypothetical protein